jgi:hypothetical protein
MMHISKNSISDFCLIFLVGEKEKIKVFTHLVMVSELARTIH